MMREEVAIRSRIRLWLAIFMVGLVASGVTAFPLVYETRLLNAVIGRGTSIGEAFPALGAWISHVALALQDVGARYPFIAYGTDWLAFAHLVIAIAFIGPWRDPIRNVWVLDFGIIACVLVIPLAMLCGPLRGIPWFWRLMDCSFGVIGVVPLVIARRLVSRLERLE
jgi:hypothetical protein